MNKALPKKSRRRWDAFVADVGKEAGLSDCVPFLENKLVNDVFYVGLFNGRPCIVKCSSRAPDAIRDEYRFMQRLYDADHVVFPEPYACRTSRDGSMAFVAMERLSGSAAVDPAGDFLRMARALEKTGLVHRDILRNILPGADGHLKLIDFQFAVDRRDYRESRYMRAHPKYLYTVFGVQKSLRLGAWNDCTEFLIAMKLYNVPEDNPVYAELRAMEDGMLFEPKIPLSARIRLHLYRLSLLLQRPFASGAKLNAITHRIETLDTLRGYGHETKIQLQTL